MSDTKKKAGLWTKIKNYFREYKVELKKIVWPTQRTVFSLWAFLLQHLMQGSLKF